MIVYISASAILTVVATGLQFVGLFLPTWWRSIEENHNLQIYYYYGIWKYPWKAEVCQEDKCHEVPYTTLMTPTWLVFTRLFEVAGAGFGILLIAIMLMWLVLLGPMRTKHLVIARKLGLVSSFLQIITAIFINIGILILVIKTSPSSILTGTFLCGLSFILFCIGGALSYHCVKRMPSGRDERASNHDPSVSVISPPPYCDPPPSYEEIMGAHYMADNPAMVVDANMSPEFNKHLEASGEFPSSSE
ncbi:Hypothetical predicted protein [Octopus vulgaris]|uniref:Uncharacterized protein n=1 Tax=Octopus vulgaris TaxID=6645 RepID=A0AA36BSP2_OCTVU|nr:Hypothetical predicted protein [Octopus vulgaris]